MKMNDPSPILLCTLVLGCIAGPCHAEPPSCSLEVVALQDNGSPAPNGLLVIVVSGERRFSRTIGDDDPIVPFPDLPCGDVSIGLHGAGGAPWHTGLGHARLESDVAGRVTLFTHPLGWIDVTVLDREGRPADWAGARVQALATAGATAIGNVLPILMGKGRTRYVVRQGPYRLTLMPERWFFAVKIDGKPARRPVAVEVATEPVNMTFTVRRPGILRGRIEDPAGIAIPWVNVNALSPGPLPPNYRGIGQTVGGVDGTFELRVDRLPVEVVVTAENRMFEPAYRLVRNHEDPLLFVGHPIRTDLRLEGRLVDHGDGVFGKDVSLASGLLEPVVEVLGSVLGQSVTEG